MRHLTKTLPIALLSIAGSVAYAQSAGGEFAITNSTIDNGGGRSSGGKFVVTASIGQPDASLQTASGGNFQITGGFWASGEVVPPGNLMFADGFEGP